MNKTMSTYETNVSMYYKSNETSNDIDISQITDNAEDGISTLIIFMSIIGGLVIILLLVIIYII